VRVRATGPMGRAVERVEKNRWRDGNEAIVRKWVKTFYEAGGFARFAREVSGSLDRKYLEGNLVFRRESAARKAVSRGKGKEKGKVRCGK